MSKPIYIQIAERLAEKIKSGELACGSSIPSVNDLRVEYGVSHVTVLRSFQELINRGMINRLPGKGYRVSFVPDSDTIKMPCLGMLLRNVSFCHFDQYFNSIISSIQEKSSEKGYCLLIPPSVSSLVSWHLEDEDRLIAEAKEIACNVQGFFYDEWIPDEVILKIQEATGLPGILINRASALSSINAVYPKLDKSLERMYKTLCRLGYQRFIFCETGIRTPAYSMDVSRDTFKSLVRTKEFKGKDCEILKDVYWKSNEDVFQILYQKLLEKPGIRTVFITPDDNFARYMVEQFFKKDILVQRDFGITGFFNLDSSLLKPELTTVSVDTNALAKEAIQNLIELMQHAIPDTGMQVDNTEFKLGETI